MKYYDRLSQIGTDGPLLKIKQVKMQQTFLPIVNEQIPLYMYSGSMR